MKKVLLVMCAVSLVCATNAMADYTITQQNGPAPTYGTTLNFDEPGGPVGVGLPNTSWTSYGITTLDAGDGNQAVGDWATINGEPWIGTGNSFFGNFGVFIKFASDLTEFSSQVWDPSGAPSPFGGGLGVAVFNDGVQVIGPFGGGFEPVEPAWGGVGDSWFNITTSGGMVFDEVRIFGLGNLPFTYVDNLSWNTAAAIPEPGSLGLIFMAAAALAVRRRK